MGQLEEIFSKPVNLRKVISQITFSEDQLERASMTQPGLYLEASRYRTLKMRKKAKAFLQLEMVRAEVSLRYRKKQLGGKALTEGAIKDRVMVDQEVVTARQAYERALEEEEWAKGLMVVFQQRLSVIKVVTEIRNSEMASEVRQVKEQMATAGMRKAAERYRDKMDSGEEEEE